MANKIEINSSSRTLGFNIGVRVPIEIGSVFDSVDKARSLDSNVSGYIGKIITVLSFKTGKSLSDGNWEDVDSSTLYKIASINEDGKHFNLEEIGTTSGGIFLGSILVIDNNTSSGIYTTSNDIDLPNGWTGDSPKKGDLISVDASKKIVTKITLPSGKDGTIIDTLTVSGRYQYSPKPSVGNYYFLVRGDLTTDAETNSPVYVGNTQLTTKLFKAMPNRMLVYYSSVSHFDLIGGTAISTPKDPTPEVTTQIFGIEFGKEKSTTATNATANSFDSYVVNNMASEKINGLTITEEGIDPTCVLVINGTAFFVRLSSRKTSEYDMYIGEFDGNYVVFRNGTASNNKWEFVVISKKQVLTLSNSNTADQVVGNASGESRFILDLGRLITIVNPNPSIGESDTRKWRTIVYNSEQDYTAYCQ